MRERKWQSCAGSRQQSMFLLEKTQVEPVQNEDWNDLNEKKRNVEVGNEEPPQSSHRSLKLSVMQSSAASIHYYRLSKHRKMCACLPKLILWPGFDLLTPNDHAHCHSYSIPSAHIHICHSSSNNTPINLHINCINTHTAPFATIKQRQNPCATSVASELRVL